VFDELPAAGEETPSLQMVSHRTCDFKKYAGGASRSGDSKSAIDMVEFIGIWNVKVTKGQRHTLDAEDGRWPRRVDTQRAASRKERRRSGGGDRMQRARRSHARRALFITAEVEAGTTRRGSDARRRTDGRLSLFPQAHVLRQPITRK
jgi:hypothetical protein